MREGGLEPPLLTKPDPKSGASTSSAIPASGGRHVSKLVALMVRRSGRRGGDPRRDSAGGTCYSVLLPELTMQQMPVETPPQFHLPVLARFRREFGELHPDTPAPAPICVAGSLVSFAWTVFPWPSALLTEAVWPARPSSVTSFRPSPSAASPFSPAARTPSPAFTMADLRVHDDRSSRSRWPIFAFTMTDLAVHDGPIFAFTMVRNSHQREPEEANGGRRGGDGFGVRNASVRDHEPSGARPRRGRNHHPNHPCQEPSGNPISTSSRVVSASPRETRRGEESHRPLGGS